MVCARTILAVLPQRDEPDDQGHQDGARETAGHDRHQGEREDHQRHGDDDVGGAAEHLVDQPVAEPGRDADADAEHHLHDGRGERDAERDARPVDETGEEIAPGLRFDAEPVLGADPAERADRDAAAPGVDEVGVVRTGVLALDCGEQRRGERDQDEQRDDGRRDEGGTLRAQPPPELTGTGSRGGRRGARPRFRGQKGLAHGDVTNCLT